MNNKIKRHNEMVDLRAKMNEAFSEHEMKRNMVGIIFDHSIDPLGLFLDEAYLMSCTLDQLEEMTHGIVNNTREWLEKKKAA